MLNFIENKFVTLYCDSCHISMRLKKSKLVNFCVAVLILKMVEESIFGILCFIILRKVKMQLNLKDLYSVWRRCCD